MTAILDTSFLFALADQSDRNHDRVVAVTQTIRSKAIQPFKLPIATPFPAVQVGRSRHILSIRSLIGRSQACQVSCKC
jgi:hypothetical protein